MTMARGGSEGKSINDSISECKSIVTTIVTLFTLYITYYHIPINNNCTIALFT
jgi:hypothetical protein